MSIEQHPGDAINQGFRHLKNATCHLGRESAFKQIIAEITTGTCMSCNSALLHEVENCLIEARSKVEKLIAALDHQAAALHKQIDELKGE